MPPRFASRLFAVALCCVLALVSFPGCDTTDPVTPANPADVAGVYDIVNYVFTPMAGAITPANVLDRLNREETFFELLETTRGGQFQLRYRRIGELADIINGDFTVNANSVTMVVREEDRASLSRLLLDSEAAFTREDDDTLVRSISKTVNLEAFDAEAYGGAGLTNVQGRLEIRLQRRVR